MRSLFALFTKGACAFVIAAGLCSLSAPGYGGLLGTIAGGSVKFTPNPTNFFNPGILPGPAATPALVTGSPEYFSNPPAMLSQQLFALGISADIQDVSPTVSTIQLNVTNLLVTPAVILGNTVYHFDLFPKIGGQSQKISSAVFTSGTAPPSGSLTFGDHFVEMTYLPGVIPGSAGGISALFTIGLVNAPEPGTYLLMGSMATIALFAVRRRKQTVSCSQEA